MAVWNDAPAVCFTADVDWASEEALTVCQSFFDSHDIHATYFMTHPSPLLSGLREQGRIDAGLHPNFLPGSSHGETIPEVMDYCMKLVPDVACFRAHRYFDVTDITHGLYDRGLRYDSNVCTMFEQGLRPFRHESGLFRFPTFLEDGTYLAQNQELDFGTVAERLLDPPGLKIIAIHPMHMVMNSPDLGYARRVKDSLSREAWKDLSGDALLALAHTGRGIRDFITDLMAYTKDRGLPMVTLKELYEMAQHG